MSTKKIVLAQAAIFSYFDKSHSRVFKRKELADILTTKRESWRLAQATTTTQFIDFLTDSGKLAPVEFRFPANPIKCYVWGEPPLHYVLTNLKSGVHFSHYSALRMHGLTEQVPKSIYLTVERPVASKPASLDLSAMEIAFQQAPRVSSNWVKYDDRRIYLLNGAHTNNLGVVKKAVSDDNASEVTVSLTGLERTLIDIAVRPFYAGGVFEVAKAFEIAKENVSIKKLVALLRELKFIYPHHQTIGYYLERADYAASQIDLLRSLPIKHDFYLVHGMRKPSYSERWRLFVPKGF